MTEQDEERALLLGEAYGLVRVLLAEIECLSAHPCAWRVQIALDWLERMDSRRQALLEALDTLTPRADSALAKDRETDLK